jgi:hypothetical protein
MLSNPIAAAAACMMLGESVHRRIMQFIRCCCGKGHVHPDSVRTRTRNVHVSVCYVPVRLAVQVYTELGSYSNIIPLKCQTVSFPVSVDCRIHGSNGGSIRIPVKFRRKFDEILVWRLLQCCRNMESLRACVVSAARRRRVRPGPL